MIHLVRTNVIGTGLFVVSASAAAVVFTPVFRTLGVAVAVVLFVVGVAAFIWGYFTAVQRSRYDNISIAALFFLLGGVANRRVRTIMNGCLVVQGSCGLVTALARTSTDGRSGSTLAFGVLVPLFGMGLNGLWSSRYGTFSPLENT
ncbi:MAG: hypothetical protein AAB327_06425 [Actinomycetota bacterium]